MVITCPSCSARYRLNPEKIEGRGAKITCPKCAHVFVVFTDREQEGAGPPAPTAAPAPPSPAAPRVRPPPRPEASSPPRAAGSPAGVLPPSVAGGLGLDPATTTGAFRAVGLAEDSAPSSTSSNIRIVAPGSRSVRRVGVVETGRLGPGTEDEPAAPGDASADSESAAPEIRSAADLDFRHVGIKTWKVKVAIGLIYDFSDIATLKKYLADKKVTPDDLISHDSDRWTRIGDIASLDQHFIDTWKVAKAAMDRGEAPPAAKKKPATTGTQTTLGHQTGSMGAIGSTTGSHRAADTSFTSAFGAAEPSPPKKRAKGTDIEALAGPPPAPVDPARRGRLLGVLALVLVVGGAVAWSMKPQDVAPTVASSAPIPVQELGPSDAELERIKEKIREELEKKRQEVPDDAAAGSAEPSGEEPTEAPPRELIPVRPEDHTTTVPAPVPPRAIATAPPPAPRATPTPAAPRETRDDPSAMYMKVGKTKLASGDFGSAVKAFETAIAKRADCGECYAGLAEAQKQLGNADAAAAAARKAAELGQPQSMASP